MKTLLALVALCLPGVAGAMEPSEPTSREFKLLLDASHFSEWQVGAEGYWEVVAQVAKQEGVGVQLLPRVERRREIVFLDTPDHQFRAHGYVLRVRTDLIGRTYRLDEESEYALKYRSKSPEEAAAANMSALRFPAKYELEQDVGYDPSAPSRHKSVYSARVKLDTEWTVRPRVASWGRYFPVLLEFGLPPKTPIEPVNGVLIREVKVSPARLVFDGGVVATADLTLWSAPDGTPLIGEFSFDHSLPAHQDEAVFRFFLALTDASEAWRSAETTKTGFTYGAVEGR